MEVFHLQILSREPEIQRKAGKKDRGKLLYDVGSGGTIIRRSLCSI